MFKTLLFILFIFSTVALAQNKSVYTDISEEKCPPIQSKEKTSTKYSGRCAGTGGYALNVYLTGERNAIEVITPSKKVLNINLWDYFANFSGLLEKAEWRMKDEKPIALIVSLNASNEGDSGSPIAYLLVSKISPMRACVINIVKPSKDQTLIAQRLADQALSKPCLKRQY